MSFLAPLFLLGVAAIALPFWLHRLQTQSSDRRPFSSAMLLQTTERQVHVRKKLKYLVLLGLRTALLLLVAAIFAKPLWTNNDVLPAPAAQGTHLIVVDTSASMSRKGLFDQAVDEARSAIASAPGDAVLQVLVADHGLREISELTLNRAAASNSLPTIRPGSSRLDFGAMIAAVDRHAEDLPQPVTLHLVSDFQDSAMPTRFADLVSTRVATLVPHVVGSGLPFNWRIDFVRETGTGLDVGVFGYGEFERATNVDLVLNDVLVDTRAVSGTGLTTLHFEDLAIVPGDNRLQLAIDADDDLTIDNEKFFVLENTPPTPVPLLTLNAGGLPVTYLSTALQADLDKGYEVEIAVIGDFDIRTLSRYRWVLVDDIGAIGPELETALRDYVQNGGQILAFAGERSASLTQVPIFGNTIQGASIGGQTDRFLSVGQVDTSHPMLAGTDGWYRVNVSQRVPVDADVDDQVLIRLENNEPFLLERAIGQGRALLVAGGLENQNNDLPIRPVFVSFIIEAARYLSAIDGFSRTYAAGASLPLSVIGGISGQVIDPDGDTVLSLADTTRAQQINLDKTGFYEVYTAQSSYLVAVNTDSKESELPVMDAATLERWVAATTGSGDNVTDIAAVAESRPVELWQMLLFVLLLVLIGESLLGNSHLTPRTATE